MATNSAAAGEIVNLETWADDQPHSRTKAIVKTDEMELIRISLPSGKVLPKHKVSGPIIVQCISGVIEFTAMGATQELSSLKLLHLMPGELHSIKAVEDAVILLTIIFKV